MSTEFTPDVRQGLLELARESIAQGLRHGREQPCPRVSSWPPVFLERRSTFVTLRERGDLRGCCGSIDAVAPLAHDVWHNAYTSAFRDPRFPPLAHCEFPALELHISVLSVPRLLPVSSEGELIDRLRIGIDGLVLQRGAARATFLPSVWDQVPDPRSFVQHLKRKVGWPPDFWAGDIEAYTYSAESFGEGEEQTHSE
jgi:AmmeMemoRadiSam system protein A